MRVENYGIEATKLRLAKNGQTDAKNRPKSKVEIWWRGKILVSLQRESEEAGAQL